MPTFRGFILQPTYRVESGVPVLHLFGRLEDGRSFLVRDRRQVPRFYVERDDAERAREKGALRQSATDQVTLLGRPVVRIEVQEPADTPPWVYVPAQYKADKPAARHGLPGRRRLRAARTAAGVPRSSSTTSSTTARCPSRSASSSIPACCRPPAGDAPIRYNRSFEYDALGDRYARFLLEEILPEVGQEPTT